MNNNQNFAKMTAVLLMATALSGCNAWSRIRNIGAEPPLTPIENPVTAPNYQPVSMPMPEQPEHYAGANSLWRAGSSGFFKDQRASKVGDIITVNVSASDAAKLENETEQTRDNNSDTVGVSRLFGYEEYAKDYLPDSVIPANLVDVQSDHDVSGEGKIDRSEKIDVTMAAIVTQVLPNGNLVIEGTQEIRVNYELRQLTVRGIIRRADISSDNSIESSKIAELRVSYGGQGTISDMQQPRYGRSCWTLSLRSKRFCKFPYYYVDAFKEKISPFFLYMQSFPKLCIFPERKVCLFPLL